MEQARYWMFPKTRNNDPNPQTFPARPTNPFGDSWEEQAFAEDAAGALGGSVWPPASYSCTFCRREFRSAQALGGHMNVHRRDRARLKQADLVPPADAVPPDHALSTCTSQICTFLNGNPNPELPGPRSPVTRVSFNGEDLRNDRGFVGPASWSSFVAEKRDREISGLAENEERKFKNVVEAIEAWPEKGEYCVTGGDLPVGCNLLIFRTQTSDGEVGGGKRRRVGENPSSLIPTVSVVDRCAAQSEALKLCPRSAEELDLELRLGFA